MMTTYQALHHPNEGTHANITEVWFLQVSYTEMRV